MEKLRFIVIGSGWRAGFYARAAKRYPDIFELTGVLCRTEEKAERISREWGVNGTTSVESLIATRPDFVVVCVSRGQIFKVTHRWLQMGFPVLNETPAGESVEELSHLWELNKLGAKVMTAEQYFRYPLIASGLRALEGGLIGEPDCAVLSLVHDYHAASLFRRMLGMHHLERLPEFTVEARKAAYPVEITDSRSGPVTEGEGRMSDRIFARFVFDNGKTALYDFDGVQYHSFIRSRHINVRGVRGEWNDTIVRYSDASHTPSICKLTAAPVPGYEKLWTPELEAIGNVWDPFVHMEMAQDEYAVATLLLDMGEYIRTGHASYPLRESLEDAYMCIKLSEAIDSGRPAVSEARIWNE